MMSVLTCVLVFVLVTVCLITYITMGWIVFHKLKEDRQRVSKKRRNLRKCVECCMKANHERWISTGKMIAAEGPKYKHYAKDWECSYCLTTYENPNHEFERCEDCDLDVCEDCVKNLRGDEVALEEGREVVRFGRLCQKTGQMITETNPGQMWVDSPGFSKNNTVVKSVDMNTDTISEEQLHISLFGHPSMRPASYSKYQ